MEHWRNPPGAELADLHRSFLRSLLCKRCQNGLREEGRLAAAIKRARHEYEKDGGQDFANVDEFLAKAKELRDQ